MSAQVKTRWVFLLVLMVCVGGSAGACQPGFAELWALFEITGLPDGSAEGLRVFAQGGSIGGEEREIGPPGTDGRTYFPYFEPASAVGNAHLRIVTAAKTIELDVPLEDGAVAEGDGVSIRVVDIDAAPPAAPTISVVLGSSPALFVIGGYIRTFAVCDCSNGREVWNFGTETVAGGYVGSVKFGTIPDGWPPSFFVGLAGKDPPCQADFPCTGDFRPMAYLPFSNDVIVGPSYCVDANDTVVSCSEDEGHAR